MRDELIVILIINELIADEQHGFVGKIRLYNRCFILLQKCRRNYFESLYGIWYCPAQWPHSQTLGIQYWFWHLDGFGNFLKDRKQRVFLGAYVLSRISKKSVLLFVICINYLPEVITTNKSYMQMVQKPCHL